MSPIVSPREPAKASPVTRIDPCIVKSIEFMRANLSRPLRVSDISITCGLSESRFCHLFSQLTGVSPKRVITQFRIERARQLLASTDIHVKQIAAMVGLPSVKTFTRTIKSACGCTPGEWRRRTRDRTLNHPGQQLLGA